MKALFIAIFLLFPFAFSATLPQVIVHLHPVSDTHEHGEHNHHPDTDNQEKSVKNLKNHIHDGQIHDFVKTERLIPRMAFNNNCRFPPPLNFHPSGNIKPPLEPPTYI